MDYTEMTYDDLDELRINLEDEIDYFPEGSERHNKLYFALEEIYEELKKRRERK